ncbi:hypothetical protein LEM8419_02263 [Neolewinella maritima]|uniref:Uncharacterized protein n=1 Tax=Neolewinella maritima TaxID=1383882 RepID=A0ABM9B213_9BACT|nr:hypothetical protein [Neolewinella maritima]CAH1001362.1 hypothetical protein LEM8419_02263 [Neolewinella maritima]
MIRKSKITSLDELRRRKKEIRMEAELAKREFAHSIGTTKGNAGKFLLKNVALPAGGALVGILALVNLASGSASKKMPVVKETRVIHEYPDGKPYRGDKRAHPPKRSRVKRLTTIIGLGRVLVPIVQAVIGTINSQKAKEAAQRAKRAAVRK